MYFLPIVDRELRVAARRKGPRRIRLFAVLAAVLISSLFLVLEAILGSGNAMAGKMLFGVLTWYTYGMCLLAGILLTSDCVSEEKREGTIGLLFLTDLRGYDVVLGKLMAVGLNAFYGLVAVLPIIALPLMMGGVTGAEYWHMAIALVNGLFFSLATGLLVSIFSRETTQAMIAALFILVFVFLIAPIIGTIFQHVSILPDLWYVTSFSPSFAFASSIGGGFASKPGEYWICLGVSNIVAWLMLGMASWALPHEWQDRPVGRRKFKITLPIIGTSQTQDAFVAAIPPKGQTFAERARLLDINPILWIAKRVRGLQPVVWFITIAGVITMTLLLCLGNRMIAVFTAPYIFKFFTFGMKILVAFQACRFFAEARRTGALELVFSTPMKSSDILKGQWLALQRVFKWPVIIFLAIQLTLTCFSVVAFSGGFPTTTTTTVTSKNGTNVTTSSWTNAPTGVPSSTRLAQLNWTLITIYGGSGLYQLVRFFTDVYAIAWFGMWLALTIKNAGMAPAMTIVFALILPAFAICVPTVIIDIVFIVWARNKLVPEFRDVVLPSYRA